MVVFLFTKNGKFSLWKSSGQTNFDVAECVKCALLAFWACLFFLFFVRNDLFFSFSVLAEGQVIAGGVYAGTFGKFGDIIGVGYESVSHSK